MSLCAPIRSLARFVEYCSRCCCVIFVVAAITLLLTASVPVGTQSTFSNFFFFSFTPHDGLLYMYLYFYSCSHLTGKEGQEKWNGTFESLPLAVVTDRWPIFIFVTYDTAWWCRIKLNKEYNKSKASQIFLRLLSIGNNSLS